METATPHIQMVDLKTQYYRLRPAIQEAIESCFESTDFINGSYVKQFQQALADYLQVKRVVTCANGTDALQIAMMALGLKYGDEVIVPSFSYVATVEVIALLGLTPIWVDVDPITFNINVEAVEQAITPRTKAIVPVHLYGQCADMEPLMQCARKYGLYVIEDTAQAIGATYTFSNGHVQSAGSIGDIGITSFFPSKNLGCYGDGGALYTNNEDLADRLAMVANHGQRKKYIHEIVGINSRLDTIQAAVLSVKLLQLPDFCDRRQQAAARYNALLENVKDIEIPSISHNSTHVYHQYTLKVGNNRRDALQNHLRSVGIPTMIYYPIPLHLQKAYKSDQYLLGSFPVAEALCTSVLSLPMHTELTAYEQEFIVDTIVKFLER